MTSSSNFERHVTGRGRIPDDSVLGEDIDEILQVRQLNASSMNLSSVTGYKHFLMGWPNNGKGTHSTTNFHTFLKLLSRVSTFWLICL